MQEILVLVISLSFCFPALVTACTRDSLDRNLYQLVFNSFLLSSPGGALTVNQYQVVCLNTASTRGEFSSVSVVVNLTCSGSADCPSKNVQQLDFACGSSVWATPSGNTARSVLATLTTPSRTDCGSCSQQSSSSPLYDRYDNVTHCISCSPACSRGGGLMECYDLTDGGCCLAVDANSSCLFNCSGAERPLPEANYTCTIFCDPLASPANGGINLTSGVLLGSVATYSCSSNYQLLGNSNRTCKLNGSSTSWSGSAPSCVSTEPLCGALEVGDNQVISYSGGCSVEIGCQATYSCADNYELVGGAITRTCSLPRDNIPVWSGLAPTCKARNNLLTEAEIAGIGIGAGAVLAVIVLTIVFTVIVVLSRQ